MKTTVLFDGIPVRPLRMKWVEKEPPAEAKPSVDAVKAGAGKENASEPLAVKTAAGTHQWVTEDRPRTPAIP